MRWWEQADTNLARTRGTATEAAVAEAEAEAEEDGVEEWWRGQKGKIPVRGTSREYK